MLTTMTPYTPAPLRAPHRAFFLLGTTGLILSLAGWLQWLAQPRVLAAPPGWLHGWFMVFGAFGPFISGFLFTAYGRWLAARPPGRACWMGSLVLQALGLVALLGGQGSSSPWTAVAAGLLLAGWGLVLGHLLRALHAGKGAALHAGAMAGAVILGLLSLASLLAWGLTGDARWALASLATAQWGFLLGVYLVVAHRMLPFFAGCVLKPYQPYRPAWALLLALFLAALHLAGELAGQRAWLWVADLPLFLLCAWLTVRWQAWRARDHRLLLALFLAWAALVAGLALLALQSVWLLASGSLLGGRGPAHLVAIGFFGAMVLAMGTRVTLGHSGRPLRMDTLAWYGTWAVLAAAGMRVLAEWGPAYRPLLLASALTWLVAVGAWAWRYAPMLWRPRIDGAPG